MYPFVASTVLLACIGFALPSSKLAINTEPALNAPTWGAPCLTQDVDGTFYSFATNMYHMLVPQAKSADFCNWEFVKDKQGKNLDAMPNRPTWTAQTPALWAPDVNRLNSTHWIMYFTAIIKGSTQHCIGAAYSTHVTGPYRSMQKGGQDVPWFCPVVSDRTIDPDGFVDTDGSRYIVFKHNMANKTVHKAHWDWYKNKQLSGVDQGVGNKPITSSCGNQGPPYGPTPIKIQQVSAQDGVTKIGDSTILIDNLGWADDGNTESPSLMRAPNGNYVLFFSHGCFQDATYATSYAVSTTGIRGPYKREMTPLLAANSPAGYDLSGSGTLDVLNNGNFGVFFSHDPKKMQNRPMRTVRFHVDGTQVMINLAH